MSETAQQFHGTKPARSESPENNILIKGKVVLVPN
jgi:hypothetical protein